MRYILYARKSSDREDRQIQSLPDQQAELTRLGRERNCTVVAELLEAKSAKAPGTRPRFQEMLDLLRSGQADGILCWSISRLARNPVDAGEIAWLLQQGGLKSILTPEREYLPEDNVLLLAVETGVANQYVIDLSRNVKRGLNQKAERGVWPYKSRIGYMFDPESRKLVADPDAFPLLRRAWEELLTKVRTPTQILENLTSWGYRLNGRPLSRSALYRMFGSRFYTGVFPYKGSYREGSHPPMVTEAEFEVARTILNRERQIQPHRHEFAYTGLMRCGICGCQITAETKVKVNATTGKRRTYTYYHCTGRRGCTKQSISEPGIDEHIIKFARQCRIHPKAAVWTVSALERDQAEDDRNFAKVEGSRNGYRADLSRRLDALYRMREDGEITREEFQERRTKYQGDIAQVDQKAKREHEERSLKRSDAIKKLNQAPRVLADFLTGTTQGRRAVASQLARGYVLTREKLEIEPDPLFDLIRTFELAEIDSTSGRDGPSGAVNPVWRCFLDAVRTFIDS